MAPAPGAAVKQYAKPGRPAKDAVAQIVGWQITGELLTNEAAIADARQWRVKFSISPP